MTQPTLNDRIATVRKLLDDVEAFMHDLRNAPQEPKGTKVLGWDDHCLFVREGRKPGELGVAGIMGASLYRPGRPIPRAWDGRGIEAKPVCYYRALAKTICEQEDLHTFLCGGLRDLYAEAAAEFEGATACRA